MESPQNRLGHPRLKCDLSVLVVTPSVQKTPRLAIVEEACIAHTWHASRTRNVRQAHVACVRHISCIPRPIVWCQALILRYAHRWPISCFKRFGSVVTSSAYMSSSINMEHSILRSGFGPTLCKFVGPTRPRHNCYFSIPPINCPKNFDVHSYYLAWG